MRSKFSWKMPPSPNWADRMTCSTAHIIIKFGVVMTIYILYMYKPHLKPVLCSSQILAILYILLFVRTCTQRCLYIYLREEDLVNVIGHLLKNGGKQRQRHSLSEELQLFLEYWQQRGRERRRQLEPRTLSLNTQDVPSLLAILGTTSSECPRNVLNQTTLHVSRKCSKSCGNSRESVSFEFSKLWVLGTQLHNSVQVWSSCRLSCC